MTKKSRSRSLTPFLMVAIAVLLATFGGAVVVVAPTLLALPAVALLGLVLLYFGVKAGDRILALTNESWPAFALFALWAMVINIPAIVAFDQTGFTKEQGLFNPQSIGRIVVFLATASAGLFFWLKWGHSPLRKAAGGMPSGTLLVAALYIWYITTAPLVTSGTPLLLATFRSLEWLVAIGLLALTFAIQTAQGNTDFHHRMRLIMPMIFFLVFSNLVFLPVVPGLVYHVSEVSGAGRLGGLFTHPNLLALVSVILCAYALAFLMGLKRAAVVVVSIAVLVLTYSRGGLAAFAAMGLFAFWFLVKSMPLRFATLLVGFVFIIAAFQVPEIERQATKYLARGTSSDNVGTLSERTAVWEAGKIIAARSPLLGEGFISGPKNLADVMINNRLSRNFAAPHAHNEFLQAMISGGPIALLLSLAIQLRIAFLLFRCKALNAKENFFAWSVFSSCFLWGILQPSLSYFLYLPGLLLIWLLLTLESLKSATVRVAGNGMPKVSARAGPQQGMKAISAAAIAGTLAFVGLQPNNASAAPSFRDNSYVAVKSGHLNRDEQRLRVWGVNIQTGVFKTYAEIDALIVRIQALGFNAIRVWPTSGTFYRLLPGKPPAFNASTAGDGSDLDRFDYLVARASQHGINIQMTMLHYLDLPTLRALPEPAITEVVNAATDDAMLRRLHGFMPYISSGYRERLELHIQRVLLRRNPYTGRRYADEPAVSAWELANEASFVHCAIRPSCLMTLPPIAISYLDSAWKHSKLNPQGAALPSRLESISEPVFFERYSRFVSNQFISSSEELRSFAKQLGGEGSGVSVQPFIFNTNPGEGAAVVLHAYSAGDVASISAYSSPLSIGDGYQGSPWLPWAAGGKVLPLVQYAKIKDKPLVMYEGSFFRPYPYRAEWGVVMAAIALRQDWDGAFLYSYGQPANIYIRDKNEFRYGELPLPIPVPGEKGEKGTYSFGFHHAGDPITMGTWSIGGRLFLTGPKDSVEPQIVWDVPIDGIFVKGPGFPSDFASPTNLVVIPRSKSMAINFTSGPVLCKPCVSASTGTTEVKTNWDTTNQQLTVETPGGMAIAGVINTQLMAFPFGVVAQATKPDFGVVAVLRRATESDILIQVLGNVANTAEVFDPAGVRVDGPAGALFGMKSRGVPPLIYSGPKVSFRLAQPLQREKFDFNLLRSTAPTASSFSVDSAESSTFWLRLFN